MRKRSLKQTILTGAILASCFMCAGCSYSVDFVVVNRAYHPVIVEYQLSSMNAFDERIPLSGIDDNLVPAKMKLDKWDNDFNHENWRKCPAQEYEFDPGTGILRIYVGPQIALRIARTSDGVFFKDGYKWFQVSSLSISGRAGTVTYEGDQLLAQFVERSYGHRFIAYKPIPASND